MSFFAGNGVQPPVNRVLEHNASDRDNDQTMASLAQGTSAMSLYLSERTAIGNTSTSVVEDEVEGFWLDSPDQLQHLNRSTYGNTTIAGNARVQLGNTIHIHHNHDKGVRKKKIDVFEVLRESLQFDHMSTRLRNIADALPETCQWLASHPDFCSWLNMSAENKTSSFLWLKGKPGCGKSTLVKQVLEQLTSGNRFARTFSHFFNARSSHELDKSSLGCYRSILYQVLAAIVPWQPIKDIEANKAFEVSDPSIKLADRTRRLFLQMFFAKVKFRDIRTGGELQSQNIGDGIISFDEHARFDLQSEAWTEIELTNFLLDFFSLGNRPVIRIFIDALDEGTEDDVRRMVRILSRATGIANSQSHSLRVCFSSRHYPNITVSDCLTLFVEQQQGHSADLEKYILSELIGDSSAQMAEMRQLVSDKAGGVFMWVVLVIPMLNKAYDRGKSLLSMKALLHEIPPDLGDVFNQVLFSDMDGFEETVSLLRWVLYAKRPMKDDELYHAVQFAESKTIIGDFDDTVSNKHRLRQYINNCSRGLVEYGQAGHDASAHTNSVSTLQFIHESVRDYLLSQSYIRTTSTSAAEVLSVCFEASVCHAYLSEVCLSYFLAACKRSIRESEPTLLNYAGKNWWRHAQAGQTALGRDMINMTCNLLTCEGQALEEWQRQDPIDSSDAFHYTISVTQEKEYTTTENVSSYFDVDEKGFVSPAGPVYYAAVLGLECVFDELCLRGYGSTVRGGYWETALNAASFGGFASLSRKLLKHGADSEVQHPKFGTALNIASEFGHPEVVKSLLETNANVNAHGRWGAPLVTASLHGREAIVRQLLKHGADANVNAGYHFTALRAAADSGHTNIVRMLLEGGADPNNSAGLGRHVQSPYADFTTRSTALQRAVAREDIASATLLLAYDAEVDDCGDNKEPRPLITAILNQNELLVKVLVDGGAHLDRPDERHITPLEYACGSINLNIFKFLLDRGADTNTRFSSGTTALERASGAGDLGLVRFLLERGANPSSMGNSQTPTALTLAARNKHSEIAELLLDRGADVNSCSRLGTPLIAACVGLGDASSMVKLLLAYGAQVDMRNEHNDETALWKAANWGNVTVVVDLLQHGANPNLLGCDNEPPYTRASEENHIEVMQVLRDYGANISYKPLPAKRASLNPEEPQCPGAPIMSAYHAVGDRDTKDVRAARLRRNFALFATPWRSPRVTQPSVHVKGPW